MIFKLNSVEEAKAHTFKAICYDINKYTNSSTTDFKSNLTFQYVFTQGCGIGACSAIECKELDIGIDLTDYESW